MYSTNSFTVYFFDCESVIYDYVQQKKYNFFNLFEDFLWFENKIDCAKITLFGFCPFSLRVIFLNGHFLNFFSSRLKYLEYFFFNEIILQKKVFVFMPLLINVQNKIAFSYFVFCIILWILCFSSNYFLFDPVFLFPKFRLAKFRMSLRWNNSEDYINLPSSEKIRPRILFFEKIDYKFWGQGKNWWKCLIGKTD